MTPSHMPRGVEARFPGHRKPQDTYDGSPLIEAIRDCMRERLVIMSHVRAGATAREISEITGMPRDEVYAIIADGPVYVDMAGACP